MTSAEGSSSMGREAIERQVDEIVGKWEKDQASARAPVVLSEGGRRTIAHFIESIATDPSPEWVDVDLKEFQGRYLQVLPELLGNFEQSRLREAVMHQAEKTVTTWEIAHAMGEKLNEWCFIEKKPIRARRQGYA